LKRGMPNVPVIGLRIGPITFPSQIDTGYGDPQSRRAARGLSSLFHDEFGVKRLAPGQIDAGIGTVNDGGKQWAFERDASTLAGNSGSMVTDFADGSTVIGLHFGGGPDVRTIRTPSQCRSHALLNWVSITLNKQSKHYEFS
jgi:hypothetical protein